MQKHAPFRDPLSSPSPFSRPTCLPLRGLALSPHAVGCHLQTFPAEWLRQAGRLAGPQAPCLTPVAHQPCPAPARAPQHLCTQPLGTQHRWHLHNSCPPNNARLLTVCVQAAPSIVPRLIPRLVLAAAGSIVVALGSRGVPFTCSHLRMTLAARNVYKGKSNCMGTPSYAQA